MADNIIWTPSMHPGEVGYYDVPNVKIPWGVAGGIDRDSINRSSGLCQIIGAINGTYQNHLWTGGATYVGGVGKLIRDMTALKDATDDLRSRMGLSAYPWSAGFGVGKRIKPRCFYELRDAIPHYMNVRWPAFLDWSPWAPHYEPVRPVLAGVKCDNFDAIGYFKASFYLVTQAGTTADPRPALPNTPGAVVTSGTMELTCFGIEW